MVVRAMALKGSEDVDYSFSQHRTGSYNGRVARKADFG
jgi:hypothetical protein